MRVFFSFFAGFTFLILAASPQAYPLAKASRLIDEIRKKEPTFSEVVRQALKREGLDRDQIRDWKKKMKLAPWFPDLAVGYDRALRETNALSITDNISVSGSGVTVGPDENDRDQTLFQGDTLRLRAVWALDEIVFHQSTLPASREAREIFKDRLALSDYLFKVYGERSQLIGDYYLMKGSGNPKILSTKEKIEALTQKLDLFTEGIFTDRWWHEDDE